MADFIVLNIKSFYVGFRTVKAVRGHPFRRTVYTAGIEGSALGVCPADTLQTQAEQREVAKLLPSTPCACAHI